MSKKEGKLFIFDVQYSALRRKYTIFVLLLSSSSQTRALFILLVLPSPPSAGLFATYMFALRQRSLHTLLQHATRTPSLASNFTVASYCANALRKASSTTSSTNFLNGLSNASPVGDNTVTSLTSSPLSLGTADELHPSVPSADGATTP